MKHKMISSTVYDHLSSEKRHITRQTDNEEMLRIYLYDVLVNAMEDIDDPDMKGRSPERYIENLMTNRLGDFSKRIILTCFKEESVVGILIALPNKDIQLESYNIYTLGVNKDFRGNGIGTELILKVKDILRNQGVEWVSLDVHEENKKAIRLYKRMGFSVNG